MLHMRELLLIQLFNMRRIEHETINPASLMWAKRNLTAYSTNVRSVEKFENIRVTKKSFVAVEYNILFYKAECTADV